MGENQRRSLYKKTTLRLILKNIVTRLVCKSVDSNQASIKRATEWFYSYKFFILRDEEKKN